MLVVHHRGPFEPDPVVSVRELDSKSSQRPAGISRSTSNPRFSPSDFFFISRRKKVSKGRRREGGRQRNEKEEAGEGEKGRREGKGHKASGKEEKERKERKK